MDVTSRIQPVSENQPSKQDVFKKTLDGSASAEFEQLNLNPLSYDEARCNKTHCNRNSIAERAVLPASAPLSLSSKPPEITLNDQQFFDECQALLRRTVLKPLPKEGVRHIHGAIHSSRVAMWIPVLISVRRSLNDKNAMAFSDDMLPWVMKAALLHDSGRRADASRDTPKEEAMSGENCENHLLSIGCPAKLAGTLSSAICNKDGCNKDGCNKDGCNKDAHNRLVKTFIEKLIHDADCLEIMRVPAGSRFDIAKLDIFQDLKDKDNIHDTLYTLADQVRTVIHQQHDMIKDVTIINSEVGFKELQIKQTGKANHNNALKAPMENSVNALQCQLLWLKKNAQELYSHYLNIAKEPPSNGLSLGRVRAWTKLSDVEVADEFDGRYQDPKTNKEYLVKTVEDGNIGRHEILMAHISRQLGMNTPIMEMVEGNGNALLCYELQDAPEPSEQDLILSNLIRSTLGEDNFNKTSFCNVMSSGKRRKNGSEQQENNAQIERAVTQLLNTDTSAITRLIECYGPDTLFDCEHLKHAIHDRLAHLARLYPQCCNRQPVPAEQQAIIAAGVRGYSLPVSFKDIEPGNFVVSEGISEDGLPFTEIQTKLRPQATQRLSGSLGLPERYTVLLQEIEGAKRLNMKNLSQASKNILNELADQCEEAARDIKDRLTRHPDPELNRIPEMLTTIQTSFRGATQQKDSSQIRLDFRSFDIDTINSLLPRLPAQDTDSSLSFCAPTYEPIKEEAKFPDRKIRFTRAREQGYQRKIRSDILHCYKLKPGNKVPKALKPVDIKFFSNDLPKGFSIQGLLRLRIPGTGQASTQTLLDSLIMLGIDTHRPSADEVQEHYLDSLLESYRLDEEFKAELPADLNTKKLREQKEKYLCGRLGWQSIPRWEQHHSSMAGRCVYYRPETKLEGAGASARQLKAMHNLDYRSKNSAAVISVIEDVLHSGATLTPIVDRLRQGLYEGEIRDPYLKGAINKVFASVHSEPSGILSNDLIFKPSLLRRTDMVFFPNFRYGDSRLASLRADRIDPFESGKLNGNNEAVFPSISLNEVESISAPQEDIDELLKELSGHIKLWPDGRPLASVFHGISNTAKSTKVAEKPLNAEQKAIYRKLTDNTSPLPESFKLALHAFSSGQFATLIENNPELEEGKLRSLVGMNFSTAGRIFHNIDFREVDLSTTVFDRMAFEKCDFSKMDLRQSQFIQCKFNDCAFDDVKMMPQQVIGCTFDHTNFSPYDKLNHDFVFRVFMEDKSATENHEPSEKALHTLLNLSQVTMHVQKKYRLLTSESYKDFIDDLCRKAFDKVQAPEINERILDRMLDLAIRMRANQPGQQKVIQSILKQKWVMQTLLNNNSGLLEPLEETPVNLKLDRVHFKKGVDFRKVDLSGCTLKGAHFSHSHFTQEQLKDQDLSSIVFFNCLCDGLLIQTNME